MNSEAMNHTNQSNELAEFTSYFMKYLGGSETFEEAFSRAMTRYKMLSKRAPYSNCQAFLSDFYKAQFES